jgi:hypothetical protein
MADRLPRRRDDERTHRWLIHFCDIVEIADD